MTRHFIKKKRVGIKFGDKTDSSIIMGSLSASPYLKVLLDIIGISIATSITLFIVWITCAVLVSGGLS